MKIVDGYSVYANEDTFYETLAVFRADGENARFESALSLDNGKIVVSGRVGGVSDQNQYCIRLKRHYLTRLVCADVPKHYRTCSYINQTDQRGESAFVGNDLPAGD